MNEMRNMKPQPQGKSEESWSVKEDAALWRAFSAPVTEADFCHAWLALLCRQLPGIDAGVVLLQSRQSNTFLPVAVWPEVKRDMSHLGKVAERALVEGKGVVHRTEDDAQRVHVAYPVEVSGRMLGAAVLDAADRSEAEVHALLRQLHWGMAWLHELFYRRELREVGTKTERIGTVMEGLATALQSGRLQQTLFDLATHVGQQLACSRVAIGLVKNHTVRVAALSNAAWFEKNASLTKCYVAAMEEVVDKLAPVSYARPTQGEVESVAQKDTPHARLVEESGAEEVFSVPLQMGAECIGVLTMERNEKTRFAQAEFEWVDALAALLPAVIDQKRRAERSQLAHLRDDMRKLMQRLFGPRYLIWKFSAAVAMVTILLMALVEVDYRVSAKTVVEGEVQRAAVAPFEGFVANSYVRAGDTVKQGQLLCDLDDRELRLEQNKWESEREQYSRKLREAMANHELSAVQVLSAQVQQAQAQLALVTDRLNRVKITAPFDGVVISGDLSQLIGSPVEQGKKLFEVAPLHAYRVILQVDERDIRHLKTGQGGSLMISGIAGQSIPLKVSKITPVATAQDGRNFFRVEASLDQAPAHLRPGMEGVGKVSTGERRLWWVLTHSFTDWLRLSLWNWLP